MDKAANINYLLWIILAVMIVVIIWLIVRRVGG